MATRVKLFLNLLVIGFMVAAGAYVHYGVNQIAAIWTEIRVADVTFFSKLVRDNWNGITSIPDDKKAVLLQNLNPAFAGDDIRFMSMTIVALFYCIVVMVVLDRASGIYRLWKTSPREGHEP